MAIEQLNRPPVTEKRFKMRVRQDEFLSEHGGRIPAGSVVPVDEETAIRWIDNEIADQAPDDAKTRKEERREEIMAELARLDAEAERGGVYNAAITRDSFTGSQAERDPMPKRMPPRRRGAAATRTRLDDADVVNGDGFRTDDEDEG